MPDTNAVFFTHCGLECKLVKQDLGHWCGYVKRPESVEPVRWRAQWDNKYDELHESEVDVWGGITYGPDGDGWVGFDDAHSRNIAEEKDYSDAKSGVKAETRRLADQIDEMRKGGQA